jgi:hypothetical protein
MRLDKHNILHLDIHRISLAIHQRVDVRVAHEFPSFLPILGVTHPSQYMRHKRTIEHANLVARQHPFFDRPKSPILG